jgi:hypothetical protein
MLYKPAMSRPCNPEQYFIGKGFTGATDKVLDVLRLWCSMLENNQPVESLFDDELPIEYQNVINELRTFSFIRQTEYLEKVFFIINKDDASEATHLIQNYLKNNKKSSHEWCVRFRVPISSHYHSIQDL